MVLSIAKTTFRAIARPCYLPAPPRTRVSTIKRKAPIHASPTPRSFSQSVRVSYPRKDSQHKDSINTEATEYSKSATDDEGARQEDAAFNPDVTDPQEQKDMAGKGTEGTDTNNPLDVSPANPEVSKQRHETEGGAENSSASSDTSSDRQRSSGGGGPRKGSKVS